MSGKSRWRKGESGKLLRGGDWAAGFQEVKVSFHFVKIDLDSAFTFF
jgi:hypothetical protein